MGVDLYKNQAGKVEYQWPPPKALAPVNTDLGELEGPVSGRSKHQQAPYEKEISAGINRHCFGPLYFIQIQ
jgi:hypothetical protein